MKVWTRLAALLVCLGTTLLPLGVKAVEATNTRPATNSAALLQIVDKAIQQGDVPMLAELYRTSTDPVARVLAAMALERIHFNLEKSSEDARICEHSLMDSQPRIAFFCARLANGNLRLRHGPGPADAEELEISRRFSGKIPKAEIEHLREYAASRKDLPELKVDRPSGGLLIPLERTLATSMRPAVDARSHGTKVRLVVDTGSSFLTLDTESARRLGVRMLDRSGLTRGLLSHDIPVSYGVLDKLTIGDVTVHNAPVSVLASGKDLIGIGLLRQLGAFRLSETSIELYGDSQPRPECREPMLVASDVWGNALRVITALPIDGTLRTTLIDSGASYYLSGDQGAFDQLHTRRNSRVRVRDMGPTRHSARVSEATADVDIGGRSFEITFQVFKDTRLPWHYILGSGALRQMDFYFDFNQRHTCLLLHDDLH